MSTSVNMDGILRKRSVKNYVFTAIFLNRRSAKLKDLKEFMDVKNQVITKESMLAPIAHIIYQFFRTF